DPDIPLSRMQSLESIVEESVAGPRFNSLLIALFAGLALLLASLGVYGVISYTVSQSTREIGVRLALGAERKSVLGLVLGRGLGLVSVGIALGVGVAFFASHYLQSLIFGVSPTDLGIFSGAAGTLALVGLLASWLPARRAMRVDPAVVLRDE
ncbi:MAG: FtsX-like permease family protein, partial [Holophagales bacterium]|nr:FtsX-like permease family protein [Holophagales bacterium]